MKWEGGHLSEMMKIALNPEQSPFESWQPVVLSSYLFHIPQDKQCHNC